jgi:hypothetical protein
VVGLLWHALCDGGGERLQARGRTNTELNMDRKHIQRLVGKTPFEATCIAALFTAGCASAVPVLTQQMADVESASRSAKELGAQNDNEAQLYLKLADEQLRDAKLAAQNDHPQTADRLLKRAKVDAELAVVLARRGNAVVQAKKAAEAADALQASQPSVGEIQ